MPCCAENAQQGIFVKHLNALASEMCLTVRNPESAANNSLQLPYCRPKSTETGQERNHATILPITISTIPLSLTTRKL